MERSKRVLSSQEQAMEEYLRRQRKEAEKHIRNSPMMGRKNLVDTYPGRQGGIVSMPGTPVGSRRSGSRSRGLVLQEPESDKRLSRGGSLERQTHKLSLQEPRVGAAYDAVSDSEYIQGNFRSSPAKENSRSLPKGTSSLNYGLLMGQIQQKRQQRQRTDGSVSDSNYSTYTELQALRGGSQSPYQWLQPANTYAGRSLHEERLGSSESINSISSSIKTARSQSLTKANVMAHQKEAQRNLAGVSSPRGFSRQGLPTRTIFLPALQLYPPPHCYL